MDGDWYNQISGLRSSRLRDILFQMNDELESLRFQVIMHELEERALERGLGIWSWLLRIAKSVAMKLS